MNICVMNWIPVVKETPPFGAPVMGYSPLWIHEDYNPQGIRECFLRDVDVWLSASWNNEQDTWDTYTHEITNPNADYGPTHWRQRPLFTDKVSPSQSIELLGERGPYKIKLDEEDRQLLLLALARLSLERPGFEYACNLVAAKMDNHKVVAGETRAQAYDEFRIMSVQPQINRLTQ